MWFLNQILIPLFRLFSHTKALTLLDAIRLARSKEFTNVILNQILIRSFRLPSHIVEWSRS